MNFKLLRFAFLSVVALGISALACSAQVGPSHEGDALVTIRGQVISQAQSTSHPSEAALAWLSLDQSEAPFGTVRLVGSSVPVTGDFPLGFEMNVYAPPPASALLPLGDPVPGGFPLDPTKPAVTAIAAIVALASNADHDNVDPRDVLGTSTNMIVVYNSQAVPPGSPSAKFLALVAAPLTPGYHLISVQQPTAQQRADYVRCETGGVCVKGHFDPGASPFTVAAADEDYAECTSASANATTCNLWATAMPTPQQGQETSDCLDLAKKRRGTTCANARTFAETVGNGSATVTMGTTPWEVWR